MPQDKTHPNSDGIPGRGEHPFLSRARAFLTFEEVYGRETTFEEVVSFVAAMPTAYWLRIASMGSIFMDHYQNDVSRQAVLYQAWCPRDLLSRDLRLEIDGESYIFHRMQFLALLRLALLHSSPSEQQTLNEDERREVTAQCLLGLNSLLHKKHPEEQPGLVTGTLLRKLNLDLRKALSPSEETFIMNLVNIYHNHLSESMGNVLGRCQDMLFDIPNDPDFSPQGVPRNLLADVLQDGFGLTLSQYAALTFGLFAKYITPDPIFQQGFHFPVTRSTHFAYTEIARETVDSYLDTIAQSQSEFAEKESDAKDSPDEVTNFCSFMLKPLVHLDGSDECYPSSLSHIQRLLDSGLTWVASRGAYDEQLRNYWGQVFEWYTRGVCQRIAADALVKPVYYPPQEYGRVSRTEESCDATLVYRDRAVLIECKIKSPKLVSTIVQKDFESFVADIKECFIGGPQGRKGASQIDKTIRAIRSRDLRLSGVASGGIVQYFPVVVTLQAWPLNPLVYEFIRMIVQKEGLLRQPYAAPLEIWSIEEFEFVEALLKSEGPRPTDMPSLIAEKLNGPYYHLPMSVFLYDRCAGNVPPNSYVNGKRDGMLETIAQTLSQSE